MNVPHKNVDPRNPDLPYAKEGSGPEFVQEINWVEVWKGLAF